MTDPKSDPLLLQLAADLCAAVDNYAWEPLSGGDWRCALCQHVGADGDGHPSALHKCAYHLARVLERRLGELGVRSNYPEITVPEFPQAPFLCLNCKANDWRLVSLTTVNCGWCGFCVTVPGPIDTSTWRAVYGISVPEKKP